jgi:hypothetical protein
LGFSDRVTERRVAEKSSGVRVRVKGKRVPVMDDDGL